MTQSNTTESLFNPMTLDVNAMEKTVALLKEMKRKQREAEANRWRVMNLYGYEIRSWQVPREAEANRWRVMNLYGYEIRSWQVPIMNATV